MSSKAARRVALLGGAVVAAAGVAAVVWFARAHADDPARCAPGLVALGARCCGEGQRLEAGPLGERCAGVPSRCGGPLVASERGCLAPKTVIEVAGGELHVGPGDWEAEGVVQAARRPIAAFAIDAFEVTEARWEDCVGAAACAPIALRGEPALPVTGVTFAEAAQLCAWARGALPTSDQLAWAAAGQKARRYAWGDTGAVCRRASWGLRGGPCAWGGTGPDLVGSRPDGASPEGVFDLAGNVAEWAVAATPSPDHAEVRGGSWADSVAARLRSWHRIEISTGTRSQEVGVRCVYAR